MKKKIVLIHDNETILNIMDEVLTEEGYDVTPSLIELTIKKIDQINPDAVIVDDYIKGKIFFSYSD